jgi:Bacterial DNA polymerase III alpha NTPase domain
MIDLGNRWIADDGTVILSADGALEALYAGSNLDGCLIAPHEDVELYQQSIRLLDMDLRKLCTDPQQLTQQDWYDRWQTPDAYAHTDVLSHCLAKCGTEAQRDLVHMEMQLFAEREMLPVLRHLIYMVDNLRKRGIVWGVGRGSSVSSYVLFLIGINRIDPMKFDLDVSEFLK